MRVAFAGTCQVSGLSAAAHMLRPDIATSQYHIDVTGTAAEIRQAVVGSDLVVTQVADEHVEGPVLGPTALAAAGLRAIYLPTFVFRGLHPDMIYVHAGAGLLPGPIGPYHSLAIAAATLLELKPARIVRLLNAHTLGTLGLLDSYADARAATIASYAPHGYDLAPAFARWEAGGAPFMHTINHPAIAVLATLAAVVLARAGLVPDATPDPIPPGDPLADAIIAPVLPAIATRVGLRGSLVWREAGQGDDPARDVPLLRYAERARVAYKGHEDILLAHKGVRAATERLREMLADVGYPTPARILDSATPM